MEQFSVYSRVLLSRDTAEAYLNRLKANLPRAGAITVIMLTEKQYEDREILIDTRPDDKNPPDIGTQLTLVF